MLTQPRLLSLLLSLCCALSLILGGCVRYDVGIEFPEQHRGQIVQHIQLGQQLTTLSPNEADRWLDSLAARAKSLEGKVDRRSADEVVLTIPFGSGAELTQKFNQFFNPSAPQTSSPKSEPIDLLQLQGTLAIEQRNWLLADQNRLRLTVDLRALGVLSEQGQIILSPGSLVNLNFGVQTPFWLETVSEPHSPDPLLEGAHLNQWQLQPGEINNLEIVFWVPSYLALGAIAIVTLCLGGFYLKYKRWPGVVSET
jgi:hypothetical protein